MLSAYTTLTVDPDTEVERGFQMKLAHVYGREKMLLPGAVCLMTLISLACLGLSAPAVWGQTTSTGGTLNVSVLDPSGAIVPAAGLELRDLSTNDIRRAETQANGVYSFPNLPFGTYELKVTAPGF